MSRSILLSLLTYSFLLAGIATVKGEFIALALPLVTYLIVGYLQAPEKITLEATRHLSVERTSPNSNVDVTVTIFNRGSSLEEMLLLDVLPAGLIVRSGFNRHMLRLAKGQSYTFAYTVSGPRGGYVFDSLEVKVNDHLAVSSSRVRVEAKGRLFVLPPVTRVRNIAIRPRRTRVYAGTISARAGGTGTDFFGVREYQPGDPPSALNWRASARYVDKLFANEFQQERVADVGIILDGRLRTNEFARGHSLFEYSVQAAASLSDALLNQSNRVGLLIYAPYLAWTLPGYERSSVNGFCTRLPTQRPARARCFQTLNTFPRVCFLPSRSSFWCRRYQKMI